MNDLRSSLRYFMYGVAVVLPVAVTVSDNVGFVTTITGRSMRVREIRERERIMMKRIILCCM